MEALSGLILQIYRAARELPVDEFQNFTLGLVRSLVPFDSARWATVELAGRGAITHCLHLINEPTDILLDWDAINQKDKLMHAVKTNPGRAYSIHADTEFASRELAVMRDYAHRYRHANIVCIAELTDTPGHLQGLSLFRTRQEDHFAEANERIVECLMPHLVEALGICRTLALLQAGATEPAAERGAMALCCDSGMIVFAGSGFNQLLREEWPGWKEPKLPKALQGIGPAGFAGKAITVSAAAVGKLLFLRARRLSPLRLLSPRELEVAMLYAHGHSHKEVAQQLGISPATVRVFLQRIYSKVNIGDKSELAAMVATVDR